jgi:FkbM family methyltransferase
MRVEGKNMVAKLKEVFEDGLAEEVSRLGDKVDTIIRYLNEQIQLQRQALLEPGHVLRFLAENGREIAMSLPLAQSDLIQRAILRSHVFFEADLLASIRRLGIVTETSTVCDVGANIGNHVVYFGSVLGAARVLAFEPQAAIHAILKTNIALNGLQARVSTYDCLVGAASGSGAMESFDFRNTGAASFKTDEAGNVPMVALDDVLSADEVDSLDLIKIDVEGMQDEVLEGAVRIIRARRPAIWVEILQKDLNRSKAGLFLSQFGYRGERLGAENWLYRV